ncbi:MAG TPA: transglycosylase SLT domain-containing protein [Rhodocyclaceae bacterium]|nr:transglycosylase SLT domain-containing protein [Rhodocyclaceae bacterium]
MSGRSKWRWLVRLAPALLGLLPLPSSAQAQATPSFEQESAIFALEAPRVRAMLEQASAAQAGRGQSVSPVRAAMLYCEAAGYGSAEAQYRLGKMYLAGQGLPRNIPVAATLFSIAAGNGHRGAQAMLLVTGVQAERLPKCLTDPDHAWAGYQAEARVDIERYVDALPKDRRRVADLIRKLAPGFAVDTRLALAVASVESNFNALAHSPRNAIGVMQLIPETVMRFTVKNAYDPEQNIRGGLAYLRWLLHRFGGDRVLAVAAYNCGEGSVDRYKGIPPYPETRSYVRRVMQYLPPLAATVQTR